MIHMTIQAEIYYIITAILSTIASGASGFLIYWQYSKKLTIDSPKRWGAAGSVIFQFLALAVAGYYLSEGTFADKWSTSLFLSSGMTVAAAGAYWLLTIYLPFNHVPPPPDSRDRIALRMKDVLRKFSKIAGVRAVCLAGRDGFIVDSIVNSGEDAEMISALASDGFRSNETMGKHLGMGGLNVSIIEYDKGPVILACVGEETFLVVVAGKGSNLGMIRLAILKHQIRLAITAGV